MIEIIILKDSKGLNMFPIGLTLIFHSIHPALVVLL
jgi:hypothetical protein